MKAVFITVTKDEAKRMIDESPSDKITFVNFSINDTDSKVCTKEYGKRIIQMHPGVMIFSNTPTLGSLELYDSGFLDLEKIEVCPTQAILFPLRIEKKARGTGRGSFKRG